MKETLWARSPEMVGAGTCRTRRDSAAPGARGCAALALCANPKGGCCLPAQLGEIQSALATTTSLVKAQGCDHSRGPSCPRSSFGAWGTCSTELPHVTSPMKRERPRHRQLWLRLPSSQQRYRGQTHLRPGPQTPRGFLHHCSF